MGRIYFAAVGDSKVSIVALTLKAPSASEAPIHFYQTTQRYIQNTAIFMNIELVLTLTETKSHASENVRKLIFQSSSNEQS
jgi:hypothetical protein